MISEANVQTEKGSRYLKALCNHFSRRVTAEYNDDKGTVQFGIGRCEMVADPERLTFHLEADNSDNLTQLKSVVGDHLEKFAANESLQIVWVDQDDGQA